MKFIIVALVVALAAAQSYQTINEVNDIDKERAKQVLLGVLEGISASSDIPIDDIFSCVKDAKRVVDDLRHAVDLLKTNKFKEVKEGISIIGHAIQVLPDAISECKAGSQEAIQIAKLITGMLKQMRQPIRFAFKVGKNLIVNSGELIHESIQAVKDWKSEEYEDFGVQIGKMIYQLLIKSTYPEMAIYVESQEIAVQVFEGLLVGFADAGGVKVADVQKCFDTSSLAVYDFVEAVNFFKQQTAESVLNGLKVLGEGLQVLPDAIYACLKTEKEAARLAEKLTIVIAEMANPQQYAFHVGKDLIVNGRNIYKEIKTAVDDWQNQEYYDFGFQCGEALYQLFVGVEEY